jgi:hypothetical protein
MTTTMRLCPFSNMKSIMCTFGFAKKIHCRKNLREKKVKIESNKAKIVVSVLLSIKPNHFPKISYLTISS